MISIKPINLVLSLVNGVTIYIQQFNTGSSEVYAVMLFHFNGNPILNHDGTTIGTRTKLPQSILDVWNGSDVVVENYILSLYNMERA